MIGLKDRSPLSLYFLYFLDQTLGILSDAFLDSLIFCLLSLNAGLL